MKKVYEQKFPNLAEYYNDEYGAGNWKVEQNPITKVYKVIPIREIDPYDGTLIARVDKDGFAWKKLTFEQAEICIASNAFEVFIKRDDDSESLVYSIEEYLEYRELGFYFYLEAGHIDPDFIHLKGSL